MAHEPQASVPTSVAFGTLSRGLTADGTARIVAVEMNEVVELGTRLHELIGASRDFFGQGMVASALLAAQIKGDERLTIQLQGQQPKLAFVCEINADGSTRARLGATPLNKRSLHHINGIMLAIKSVQNRELYRGVTEIRDCTLAEALASHLRESQQVTSGLKIYVCQNDENEQVARGLLWEQLPGEKVGGDSLDELELTRILEAEDFDAAITNLCTTESGRVLSHQALYWSCPCSMERVEVVIRMLGSQSLKDMILEDEPASVNCHFCNSTREVTVERLRELLDESDGQEP